MREQKQNDENRLNEECTASAASEAIKFTASEWLLKYASERQRSEGEVKYNKLLCQ